MSGSSSASSRAVSSSSAAGEMFPATATAPPAAFDQQAGEARRRRLAVGPGHAEHARRVARARAGAARARARRARSRPRARHRAARTSLSSGAARRVSWRKAGRERDESDLGQQGVGEFAAAKLGRRTGRAARAFDLRRLCTACRRRAPTIPARGSSQRAMASPLLPRPRLSGSALRQSSLRAAPCGASLLETARRCAHRIFNVERPTSTSIMLMIQNLTTTCVSFHPDSSKW